MRDAAVIAALEHVEEHLAHYRTGKRAQSGKLVVAKFNHATSRAADPQLHSHAFFLNVVRAKGGSSRAQEPLALFQNQKSLGLLYRQALVRELKARGFEVEIRDRSLMSV